MKSPWQLNFIMSAQTGTGARGGADFVQQAPNRPITTGPIGRFPWPRRGLVCSGRSLFSSNGKSAPTMRKMRAARMGRTGGRGRGARTNGKCSKPASLSLTLSHRERVLGGHDEEEGMCYHGGNQTSMIRRRTILTLLAAVIGGAATVGLVGRSLPAQFPQLPAFGGWEAGGGGGAGGFQFQGGQGGGFNPLRVGLDSAFNTSTTQTPPPGATTDVASGFTPSGTPAGASTTPPTPAEGLVGDPSHPATSGETPPPPPSPAPEGTTPAAPPLPTPAAGGLGGGAGGTGVQALSRACTSDADCPGGGEAQCTVCKRGIQICVWYSCLNGECTKTQSQEECESSSSSTGKEEPSSSASSSEEGTPEECRPCAVGNEKLPCPTLCTQHLFTCEGVLYRSVCEYYEAKCGCAEEPSSSSSGSTECDSCCVSEGGRELLGCRRQDNGACSPVSPLQDCQSDGGPSPSPSPSPAPPDGPQGPPPSPPMGGPSSPPPFFEDGGDYEGGDMMPLQQMREFIQRTAQNLMGFLLSFFSF